MDHEGLLGLIARKFLGKGVEREDLIQAGYVGLMKAKRKFDATKGFKFITYAKFWVYREMSRLMERHRKFSSRHTSLEELATQGHEPSENGFESYGGNEEECDEATPDKLADLNADVDRLKAYLPCLSKRELSFVWMYFWEHHTYADISRIKGVQKSYARKVVLAGIAKLKAKMIAATVVKAPERRASAPALKRTPAQRLSFANREAKLPRAAEQYLLFDLWPAPPLKKPNKPRVRNPAKKRTAADHFTQLPLFCL